MAISFSHMGKPKHYGRCHICGHHRKLSFEHIPPEKAFNNRPVVLGKFKEAIEQGLDYTPRGPQQQRGAGAYTLCEECNSKTGSWYGSALVEWCYQGYRVLRYSRGEPTLSYPSTIYPLRVAKQIVTMFLAVNQVGFRDNNPELVDFVLDKERKNLNPKYRFFAYHMAVGMTRHIGTSALGEFGSSDFKLISEITFPPYGYVFCIGSGPPDDRLVEITHFSGFNYESMRTIFLDLPVLPTHLPWLPGDYRTEKELRESAGENY